MTIAVLFEVQLNCHLQPRHRSLHMPAPGNICFRL